MVLKFEPTSCLAPLRATYCSLVCASMEIISRPRHPSSDLRATEYLSDAKVRMRNAAANYANDYLGGAKAVPMAENFVYTHFEIREAVGSAHPDPAALLELTRAKIQKAADCLVDFSRSMQRAKPIEDLVIKELCNLKNERNLVATVLSIRDNLILLKNKSRFHANVLQKMAAGLRKLLDPSHNPSDLIDYLPIINVQAGEFFDVPFNPNFLNKTLFAFNDAIGHLASYSLACKQKRLNDEKNQKRAEVLNSAFEQAKKATLKYIGNSYPPIFQQKISEVIADVESHSLLRCYAALRRIEKMKFFGQPAGHFIVFGPELLELRATGTLIKTEALIEARLCYNRQVEFARSQMNVMKILGNIALAQKDRVGDHLLKTLECIRSLLYMQFLAIEKAQGKDISQQQQIAVHKIQQNRSVEQALRIRTDTLLSGYDADLRPFMNEAAANTTSATQTYEAITQLELS